jgi:hypothetical protein
VVEIDGATVALWQAGPPDGEPVVLLTLEELLARE